jgi:hypothetical protein
VDLVHVRAAQLLPKEDLEKKGNSVYLEHPCVTQIEVLYAIHLLTRSQVIPTTQSEYLLSVVFLKGGCMDCHRLLFKNSS